MKSSVKTQSQNGAAQSAKGKKIPAKSDAAAGLRDLFEDSLKDIYWAEKALTKALPKMIKNATSQDLVDGITSHLEETKNHVTRLEDVFSAIGVKAQAKKCEAMDGLLKEAQDIMESTEDGMVRDAGIILAGQKVEHYEIATYGTLCAFAKILDENDSCDLLMQTLTEEKAADEKLSQVAENSINVQAAEEGSDDEDEDASTAVKTKSKINTKTK